MPQTHDQKPDADHELERYVRDHDHEGDVHPDNPHTVPKERGQPPTYTSREELRAHLRQFAMIELHLVDDPTRRGLSRLLTTTFLHDPEFAARVHGQHSPHAAFVEWLEHARADGSLAFESEELTARVFYGLVEGCLTWNALMSDGASLRAAEPILTELIELFLARYGASSDS